MSNLNELSIRDTYSLMMFALYKITDLPEYAAISELIYILDENSLLKLCEYYGGMTIKIPTLQELQNLISALTLYYRQEVLHETLSDKEIKENHDQENSRQIQSMVKKIHKIMEEYKFVPRES